MPSDEDFENLINSLGSLVGENEIVARQAMGDGPYEELMATIKHANALSLAKDEAQIHYLKNNSFLQASVGLFVMLCIPLSIAWSFFFWLK